ncbi:hypothetical protein CPB83DRAFT_865414 [Crepidotus variabilis]|uniref:N-acetyltransferase domain-containing protein n=1 Tax=Crepidotus variabilis TaxID=179855 RepID=A0A9P6E2Z3_9AGAR|nr:hypothetical protein CPB83DRAFT_865414 [Crepidotus variabilis]
MPDECAFSATAMVESYPIARHLLKPSEDEIERCVAVLVDAFLGDPFGDVMLADYTRWAPAQLRMNIRAALFNGQIDVMSIGPSVVDIVGVALWWGPGEQAFPNGWNQFMKDIPPPLREWWLNTFIPTLTRLSNESIGEVSHLNSWHLSIFGVSKEHQRKGYGGALMELVANEARESKSPMVLETFLDKNVEIYKKLGFEVKSEATIEDWREEKTEIYNVRLMVKTCL